MTPPHEDAAPARWFLSASERGNPHTRLTSQATGRGWTTGNAVEPVVHGAHYFRRVLEQVTDLRAGDQIYFTDWRGDGDERLAADGPTVHELLCGAARRGVEVRGLLWRSHSDHMSFSAQQNQRLGAELNEAGAEALLDQRVRRFGSHHQKLLLLQRAAPAGAVAYVGGIDLSHSRRDDAEHRGDPQQQPMDARYGPRAPWHDLTMAVRGPAVGELLETFAERWDDPTPLDRRTPYRMLLQRRADMPRRPRPLPARGPLPEPCGEQAVQVLRTYSRKRPRFPFAPQGERSIARAYEKAFGLARSLIYIEDQYLWSPVVARLLVAALRRAPALRVIAVVPRFPDADGTLMGPVNRIGQIRAMTLLRSEAPDRVGVFDLENAAGTPIYVHAKTCMVDDVWFTCGSDNFNRRSWTSDSELACAVVDTRRDPREPTVLDGHGAGARVAARDLRLQLWAEHLGLAQDDPRLLTGDLLALWTARAADLDRWHAAGGGGARPPGQARRHDPDPVSRVRRLLADPLYALVADPDGRSRRQRRRHEL
jgi:phosphatidylserine/phosphatidylglycerophosphate/cardiolipin synthase-like enzyme